jgi:diguanylate cyclase (GGDEF)-like protein
MRDSDPVRGRSGWSARGTTAPGPLSAVAGATLALTALAALVPPAGRIGVVAAVQVLGSAAVVAAVRRHRPARPGVWWSMLVAADAYSLAWWCVVVDAGPAPVAVFCLGAFVAMARLVVLVAREPDTRTAVDRLDVALLAVCASAAALQLTGALSGDGPGLTATTDTWVAAQAAGTVVFSTTGVWAVVTGRSAPASVRLLVVVATGLVLWHASTLATALTGTYRPGAAVDVLVVPGWGALVAAAWQPTMRALGRPVAPAGRSFPGSLAVLAAALTLGVLPVVGPAVGSPVHPAVLALATTSTVVLLLVREVVVARGASRLAASDPLTGLGSRRALVQALGARLTDPASGPALLCVVDLESFQDVNDTRGHVVGDRVLEELGRRLAAAAGPQASSYRIGGDEFAVLVPRSDAPAPGAAPSEETRRLLDAIAEPLPAPGGVVRLRARAGEVDLDDAGDRAPVDPDDDAAVQASAAGQLGHAELALAEAGRRGARAVRATPQLLATHRGERALAEQLPTALTDGQVVPHYQALVGLGPAPGTDRVAGFEALARWYHPSRGVVGAEQLVPVAERLGVLGDLDDAVLRAALGDCARWRAGVPGLEEVAVWVNASAASLLREDLAERVAAELEAASLPGGALVLEITENAWLTDRAGIAARLLELQSGGVRIAVDDFGTGFASLDYLVSFPVDALKVDRSLVERSAEPACARLMAGIVAVTRDLGVSTLAEGVGTLEQVESARALGFDTAQGFVFGRPVPASEVGAVVDLRGGRSAQVARGGAA